MAICSSKKNRFHISPHDEKDLNDFFESMNAEQFDKVNQFFDTMPRLRHIVKIVNPKTKVESEVLLEGLESFLE